MTFFKNNQNYLLRLKISVNLMVLSHRGTAFIVQQGISTEHI